ncbi:hypothetical protein [Glycomyces tenuis]|uniref:hypothetical protein n=2 Tax=Glycomyces tenuis TaxID=58116 RepID=UPI00040597A0|nr:hypothetical protein [Glycomyces tenuis]
MYGSLAAVLAGFAFTGLVLYLGRQNAHPVDGGRGAEGGRIEPKFIVKTLFYAMSSLMICAFLYAHLASKGPSPHQALLGLSLSGLVLGPGVLSLFYALNLVMVNHAVTRAAAESTRWVVAAVGPAVTISLLTDIFDRAWDFGCGGACPGWLSPRWWGFGIAVALAVVGLLITMPPFTAGEPLRRRVEAMVRTRWLRRTSDLMRRWPDAPALLTLVLASIIAVTSMWSRGGAADLDPRYWVHAVMGLMAVVMVAFAFATGSVLAPMPFVRFRRIDGRKLRCSLVAGRPWARVATCGRGRAVLGMVVGLDSNRPRWKAPRGDDWVGADPRRRRDVEHFAKRVWEARRGTDGT